MIDDDGSNGGENIPPLFAIVTPDSRAPMA